ncbi:MAG: O-antigen ligase family protein [Tepidisphaeraceae bacterium]
MRTLATDRGIGHGDYFLRFLGIALLGYAVIGKGFAYIGVPPLYIGEMVLAYGVFALCMSENWSRVLRTGWVWPLLAYMAWGLIRTVPYISIYGPDALRDAAIWIWGLFSIVIASLLACEPRRLLTLERYFRVFAKIFIIVAPITYCIYVFYPEAVPDAPWADVPLILIKGGDVVVHLTGIFAFAVLLGGLNPIFIVAGLIIDLGATFTGRAAMVTFGMGSVILACMRPKSPIIRGVFATLLLGVAIMWIYDIHIKSSHEPFREISADQIFQNVQSIFTNSDNQDLAGSKEWRLLWWDTIFNYTVHGKYFWTGKGFGVNLADDDGFQVEEDHSLRSPHNGHLTQLARGGVPGLALWIVCHLTWLYWMIDSAVRAHRSGQTRWTSLFVFLIIYWAAFMTNAAFDVYLEGPTGGIWMWTVYGVGLGALWIYRKCPESFEPKEIEAEPAREIAESATEPQEEAVPTA